MILTTACILKSGFGHWTFEDALLVAVDSHRVL
jgi:hypothetical protein